MESNFNLTDPANGAPLRQFLPYEGDVSRAPVAGGEHQYFANNERAQAPFIQMPADTEQDQSGENQNSGNNAYRAMNIGPSYGGYGHGGMNENLPADGSYGNPMNAAKAFGQLGFSALLGGAPSIFSILNTASKSGQDGKSIQNRIIGALRGGQDNNLGYNPNFSSGYDYGGSGGESGGESGSNSSGGGGFSSGYGYGGSGGESSNSSDSGGYAHGGQVRVKRGALAHLAGGGLFDDFDFSGDDWDSGYDYGGSDLIDNAVPEDLGYDADFSSGYDYGSNGPDYADTASDTDFNSGYGYGGGNGLIDQYGPSELSKMIAPDSDGGMLSKIFGGSGKGALSSYVNKLTDGDPITLLKTLGFANSILNHKKQPTLQEQAAQLKSPYNSWTSGQQASADKYFNSPPPTIQPYSGNLARSPVVGGEHRWFHADGGLAGEGDPQEMSMGALGQVAAGPGIVRGEGGGQDDMVNAMLSPGEYIFDAESVSALGDGDTDAGAAQLDQLRMALREHKRSARPDSIGPKAKDPMQYMNGGING